MMEGTGVEAGLHGVTALLARLPLLGSPEPSVCVGLSWEAQASFVGHS